MEPENALQKEIAAWTHLYERIEQEILHPGPHLADPARPINKAIS